MFRQGRADGMGNASSLAGDVRYISVYLFSEGAPTSTGKMSSVPKLILNLRPKANFLTDSGRGTLMRRGVEARASLP